MKNKKIVPVAVATLIGMLLLITVVIAYVEIVKQHDENSVGLYFLNPVTNALDVEKREIEEGLKQEEILEKTIESLMAGPKNSGLVSAFDTEVSILSVKPYLSEEGKGLLDVNLSKSFNSISESRKLICIGAIVYTFTDLDFVDGVTIYVDEQPIKNFVGKPLRVLSKENVLSDPSINPDKINRKNVVLYFKDKTGEMLVAEERSIEVKQSQTLEYQIVEQLIIGTTNEKLNITVPVETKIRDIKTEEGICYVNLSSEFTSKGGNVANSEKMAIYSIVNSLTELDTVEKVQFLIEGEKINDYKGRSDFSKPFARNDAIIQKDDSNA